MIDPIAQFRNAFFEEAAELVDSLEAMLLRLDLAALEAEDLHTLFRMAHSIKGNAATFGFPAVAAFTHELETTLEPVRQGALRLDAELLDILLASVDLLRKHLAQARADAPLRPEDQAFQDALVARLKAFGGGQPPVPPAAAEKAAPVRGHEIRFTAPPDTFRRGVNLERLFRDLGRLGACRVWLDLASVPRIEDMDPETCALAWDIRLEGDVPVESVQEAFEFVDEGANVVITPLKQDGAVPKLGELLVDEGEVSPAAVRQALARQQPLGDILVGMGAAKPETVEKALQQQQKKRNLAEGSTLRVSTEKIDKLVDLVGELVITQAMLAQSGAELMAAGSVPTRMQEAMQQLDRQTRDLQEQVMGMRMVPMELVFSRFPRMVRELGKQLGKEVELELEGTATELDKTFIELLVDPLTHLVRNAVDHGLEASADRAPAGKPQAGRITLRASSRGGSVFIEVADDGRGLDPARLLAKAVERGIVAAGAVLDEQETFALIFAPGFSTASQVSDVSGRGVGLDVVKQNIAALNGRVEVDSALGRGTTFRLVLPLTLAILDGLTVQVGAEVYVLPLASVVETFLPRAGEVQTLQGSREVIGLRGDFISVLRLPRILGIAAGAGTRSSGAQPLLCVVESEGRHAALAVDDVLGQQQVVIKSLEAHFRKVEGVSGATILGNGHVSLILDIPGLLRMDSLAAAVGA